MLVHLYLHLNVIDKMLQNLTDNPILIFQYLRSSGGTALKPKLSLFCALTQNKQHFLKHIHTLNFSFSDWFCSKYAECMMHPVYCA